MKPDVMKDLIERLYSRFDKDFVKKHTEELAAIERRQTFPAYNEAAEYTYGLLTNLGFDAEIIRFPADGRAVYQDKRTPLAWDASAGRLTVLSAHAGFKDPVIADFEKEPFALIKHSVATPAGGIATRLITQAQALSGEDARGAMVLCDTGVRPDFGVLTTMLDLGALGLVSDCLTGWELTQDCTAWINSGTEKGNWRCQEGERDFINFSVTPRVGRKLREAANRGEVLVRVESDGRRYEGHIDAVTALIPGRRPREVWILAHLNEPLQDDNSAGVICGIWIAEQMRRMAAEGLIRTPEFSLRLVFAAEMYGFAAFADRLGGDLRERTVAGLNIDGLSCGKFPADITIHLSPYSSVPNFSNMIMRDAARAYGELFDSPKVAEYVTGFGDDMFLGDRTNGLPVIYPLHKRAIGIHHNSVQTKEYLEMEPFAREGALCAAYIIQTAAADETYIRNVLPFAVKTAQEIIDSEANAHTAARPGTDHRARLGYFAKSLRNELADFRRAADIPEIDAAVEALTVPEISAAAETTQAKAAAQAVQEQAAPSRGLSQWQTLPVTVSNPLLSQWLRYAEKIVPARAAIGFPYDLVNLPYNERGQLPFNMIYGPFANIMSLMDGERNLADIIIETEWETHRVFTERELKRIVDATLKLGRGKYLTLKIAADGVVTREKIAGALISLGVKKGDSLLVHSSATGLGYVEGGPDAVIDGFLDAVGDGGNIAAAALTTPYIGFEGEVNKSLAYRPYSPENINAVWTGLIPKTLFARPGAIRSPHASHSWVAFGPDARALTEGHGMLTPPASPDSPMAKVLARNGKAVFFGCSLSSNTFLHFLEDVSGLEYLRNAVVKIKDARGNLRTAIIPRNLPGHRDFYRRDAENVKFYKRAAERGLRIREAELGAGKIYVMELRQLYEIGMRLIAEDKRVLLCDDPTCPFCSKYM